jgi:transcriptional regulator with XRE-family HTH domain
MKAQLLSTKTARTQPSMLTPAQLRAARALVGWSRETLAEKSGTAAQTVQGFEALGSDPKLSTLNKWYRALEGAGVEFIDDDAERGPGVRLRYSAKLAGKRK